jgi:hypothetical protein
VQKHLPGTASSYSCSAGSVCLNFLQMIKGGLTDIAKFHIYIFDTNIENNCDIHNTEIIQVHFIHYFYIVQTYMWKKQHKITLQIQTHRKISLWKIISLLQYCKVAGYQHIVRPQQWPLTKNWLWTSQFQQPLFVMSSVVS